MHPCEKYGLPTKKREENTSIFPPPAKVKIIAILRVRVVFSIHHATVDYFHCSVVRYHVEKPQKNKTKKKILQTSESRYEDLLAVSGLGRGACL